MSAIEFAIVFTDIEGAIVHHGVTSFRGFEHLPLIGAAIGSFNTSEGGFGVINDISGITLTSLHTSRGATCWWSSGGAGGLTWGYT